MKIVLTGASGFIGGAFLRHMLAQGPFEHRMICLSSSDAGQEKLLALWPDLEVYALRSIREKKTRDAIQGADALIHCAWSTVPRTANADPGKDLLENVYNGLPLIEMAADLGIGRFIFMSSGGTVYGKGHHEPLREDHLTIPFTAYGISKLSFEHYLRDHAMQKGMRHVILRPGNIYGRASDPLRPQGVIEHWMQRIIRGEALDIWSSRNVVRDFVHIDDMLEVLKQALAYEGEHSLFNVGSGKGTSLGELMQLLGELANRELETTWQEDGDPLSDVNILDTTLLRQEFGLAPDKPLGEGLRQLWNGLMAEHQRRIDADPAIG